MNADQFLAALGRQSLAASVLVLLVLLAQRAFRKQLTPQWHCALWLLVVARLLPFSFSSPVSILNVFPSWSDLLAAVNIGPGDATPGTTVTTAAGVVDTADGVPAPPLPTFLSYSDAAGPSIAENPASPLSFFFTSLQEPPATGLFYLWVAGATLLTGYVLTHALYLARLTSRSKPVEDPDVLSLWNDCCARMGINHPPQLIETTAVQSPALHGFLRPKLMLPRGFTREFSRQEVRFVFLHEVAHVQRSDLALNWLITALQIVHWFNPLLWFAFARWRLDREIACDAAALEVAGSSCRRAYGRTMLRLLERFSAPVSRPGFVGILENKRQLRRRISMIAALTPTRNPLSSILLLTVLALVGLTDAQVAQGSAVNRSDTPVPSGPAAATPAVALPLPRAPYVLFLINRSETMLGETEAEIAEARTQPDHLKLSAAKWQHAAQVLQTLLVALPRETNFQVAVFGASGLEPIGIRDHTTGGDPIAETVQRLRTVIPSGDSNLEAAFSTSGTPEQVVLITDSLPTRSMSEPPAGEITEANRIKFFEAATRSLSHRSPVQTILLPLFPRDPGAAGLYWELAHASRGGLTTLPRSATPPRTHLAFVVDTSGSMRDPNTGGLWPAVIRKIEDTLDAHPNVTGLQLVDGDGRFLLRRRGNGANAWAANTPETRDSIRRVLGRYDQDTVSNPVPGIYNVMRFLRDPEAAEMRIGIFLLGDEFNSADRAETVVRRLDELNPRDANGQRAVVINAIGFPTTIRYQFSMGNTGLRFADLMRTITHQHGGTFIALPEL